MHASGGGPVTLRVGRLWRGSDAAELAPGQITWDAYGRIVEVGAPDDRPASPAEAVGAWVHEGVADEAGVVLDLGDRAIAMPGLVNAHAHTPTTWLRGLCEVGPLERWLVDAVWPLQRHQDAEMVALSARLGYAEQIRHGITATADFFSAYQEEVAAEAVASGMRVALTDMVFGVGTKGLERAESSLAHAATWMGSGDGRITAWAGPHAVYSCDDEVLARLAAGVAELGLPGVHVHVAETADELEKTKAARQGRTPLQVLADTGCLDTSALLAHLCWPTEEDLAILGGSAAAVVHNPTSNLKLGDGVAPVSEYLDRGVDVVLGSDGPASNNRQALLHEARLATLLPGVQGRTGVISAELALAMATTKGHVALRLPGGRLIEGAPADLCVLLPHPERAHGAAPIAVDLIHTVSDGDVVATVVQGRPLLWDGELIAIDADDAARTLQARTRQALEATAAERSPPIRSFGAALTDADTTDADPAAAELAAANTTGLDHEPSDRSA